jgi:LSD1 subclass zinc finger protein
VYSEVSPVLLTCPTCRSGLEVPDGTTAMVRCPACKTVFSPAAGLTPPPDEELDEELDDEPKSKKSARKKPAEEEETENRDFEPGYFDEKPKRRRRRFNDEDDDSLSPEERRAFKAAFTRAAWGSKLIWISFILFMISMMFIIIFWFGTAFSVGDPTFVTIAGVFGLLNWFLAAVGVGLCLSGPRSPGHWGYGIAAAVATSLHLLMVAILAGQGTDYSVGKEADPDGPNAKWGLVPTRLDAVAFYITLMVYHDEEIIPKGDMKLSIVVGVMEMVRNLLILMLLSCLARASGEEELSHQCTRAAGFASLGPGAMAVAMLLFAIVMVETNLQSGQLGKILFTTIRMGTYAIYCGTLKPGLMAARQTADACDEPYQSRIPQL